MLGFRGKREPWVVTIIAVAIVVMVVNPCGQARAEALYKRKGYPLERRPTAIGREGDVKNGNPSLEGVRLWQLSRGQKSEIRQAGCCGHLMSKGGRFDRPPNGAPSGRFRQPRQRLIPWLSQPYANRRVHLPR